MCVCMYVGFVCVCVCHVTPLSAKVMITSSRKTPCVCVYVCMYVCMCVCVGFVCVYVCHVTLLTVIVMTTSSKKTHCVRIYTHTHITFSSVVKLLIQS
jgi:hypothetical protein